LSATTSPPGATPRWAPGATTADLLDLVPEPCTERFLDVGCGAGTLALLAAARGADATGTDINPRAIALSEFNATLNGLTARFVVGDLLAPVAGEHFDRVVSQPPFVMQRPGGGDATFLFGGPWGDELTQRLLSALPAVLSPGGVALVRIDSLGRPGDPLPTRVRKLVGAAPVDVVTLLTRGMNLDQLCMGYASLEDPTLGPAYERAARDFRTHVADLGARNAVQALVCLYRRRDDRPGGAAVGLPVTTLRRADADTVATLFDALPRAQAPDAALLGLRLALHPGAHFTETRDGPDRAEPPKLTLSFAQGLCGESQLSENSLGLLECIVAGGTLAEAVARYAEMVEAPVAAVTPEALRFVRDARRGDVQLQPRRRPQGFTPLAFPGKVVRVNKAGSLRPGGLFPKPDDARAMVNRAVVMELSGRPDRRQAWRAFVHPSDRVAIKVNGLGLRNMASNKEVVEAIAEGLVAAGVPAAQITVYDQWDSFLAATRVNARGLPAGVRVMCHNGTRLSPETRVASGRTQYALPCSRPPPSSASPSSRTTPSAGFTGALKNMTHGSIKNPEAFHRHLCSPQIAELYAHDAIRSRVAPAHHGRLQGRLPRRPPRQPRAPRAIEAVFASTDPVALDRVGSDIVDQLRTRAPHDHARAARPAPPLHRRGRRLGLGVADRARIETRAVNLT
jgi:SAM-dependent methyltransferase